MKFRLFEKPRGAKISVSDLAVHSGDEFYREPWHEHWQHKCYLRRRLRRSYILLVFSTVFFGGLVFGLYLVAQGGGQRSKNLWNSAENLQMADGYRARIMAVVENPHPKAKELEVLRGAVLSDAALRHWGEVRQLTNGSGDADLLYFENAGVYLLRRGQRIFYAGRKKP